MGKNCLCKGSGVGSCFPAASCGASGFMRRTSSFHLGGIEPQAGSEQGRDLP